MKLFTINRNGKPNDFLWNKGFKAWLIVKWCGFYIIGYKNIVAQPVIQSVGGLAPMDTNKYCAACGLNRKKCPAQIKNKTT